MPQTKRAYSDLIEKEGPVNDVLAAAVAKARDLRVGNLPLQEDIDESASTSTSAQDNGEEDSNTFVAMLDLTENSALQFANSGYAPLDLFFRLVRSSSNESIEKLLQSSWSQDPIETIQILMHARDARSGKGERAVVRHGLLWLRRNKPITYLRNLNHFIELGYFKDLLHIAAECNPSDERLGTQNELIELELFAAYLEADRAKLLAGQAAGAEEKMPPALSLAAKYAPSENRAFDKEHKFAGRVAGLMFPELEHPKKHYRKFLAQARERINIVETQMSNGDWHGITYGQVPSRAHRTYRNAFKKHDESGYAEYLSAVRDGKQKINTAGTQPHELVRDYLGYRSIMDETIEAQWKGMIARLEDSGKLKQSLAVVDVSGSMSGQPAEVAVALGLVTAELNEGSFHNRVITFSTNPKWEIIQGDSLYAKVKRLSRAHWDMSTNIEKVFELILSTAIRAKVPKSEMPVTLFIFSDMQFDQACSNANTDTIYRMSRRKYLVHDYDLPSVVFWNLRSSTFGAQFPVTMDEAGTALVSGFSADLLKLFLDGEKMNPMNVLRKAIAPYSKAVVEESEAWSARKDGASAFK